MTKKPLFPITLFVPILILLLISGCGHSGANTNDTNQPPTLISIAVTPAARSIPLGGTRQFGVTGIYSDGSQESILANSVTWSSSETGIMSVNSGGLATPNTQGTTTLSAAYGGITVSLSLSVTPNIAFTNWTTANNPAGVAVDALGSIYVANAAFSNHSSMITFSNHSSMIHKYNAPPANQTAPFNVSITSNVAGVALDNTSGNATSGYLYVTDYYNNHINIYNSAGTLTATWSTPLPTGAPTGVAVDSSGNVYVTDARNNYLYKYNSSGSILASWSTTGVPSGVAVDSSFNVYVADLSDHMIIVYSSTGTQTASWSTTGTPFGVAVNPAGTKVYVADAYNYLIREFVPPPAGSRPGTPWSPTTYWSTIGFPNAVAVDSSGNVYVVDSTNNVVRKYPPQ